MSCTVVECGRRTCRGESRTSCTVTTTWVVEVSGGAPLSFMVTYSSKLRCRVQQWRYIVESSGACALGYCLVSSNYDSCGRLYYSYSAQTLNRAPDSTAKSWCIAPLMYAQLESPYRISCLLSVWPLQVHRQYIQYMYGIYVYAPIRYVQIVHSRAVTVDKV